jgi:hypothetical protein
LVTLNSSRSSRPEPISGTASQGSTIHGGTTAGQRDFLILTATSGDDLDGDGYVVSLDGSLNVSMAVNDLITLADISPGDHTISIDAVAPNCAVLGEIVRGVLVAVGARSDVDYAIECSAIVTSE